MTRQDFDALVARLEKRYAGRDAALRRATLSWLVLGITLISGWLLLTLVGGAALFVQGMFLAGVGGICLLILGGLLVGYTLAEVADLLLIRSPAPEGRTLEPAEAPQLWQAIGELQSRLGCRPPRAVVLTLEMNASVCEIPRLGFLGFPRSYIKLGLPLLEAVSADELRAVLAHEFAHLSSRHGQTGHRIYRLHRMLENVIQQFQRPPAAGVQRTARRVTGALLGWFWPRFHARALLLSRRQEYQADAIAGQVTERAALAMVLWRIGCVSQWLEERFWVTIRQLVADQPRPPANVLDLMRHFLAEPPAPADGARWVDQVLSEVTGTEDTHPGFSQRVSALGLPPDWFHGQGFPRTPRVSAGAALLGAERAAIEQDVADRWRREMGAIWQTQHRSQARPATRPHPAAPSSQTARWEEIVRLANTQSLTVTAPQLCQFLEDKPEHLGANTLWGRHQLESGDGSGEARLEWVIERQDEQWTPLAFEALARHLRGTGQAERWQALRARADRFDAVLEASRKERSTVTAGDPLAPHQLDEPARLALSASLASEPGCCRAWLARKQLQHFPQRPLYVLAVSGVPAGWWKRRRADDQALALRLSSTLRLPGQLLVIPLRGYHARLARRVAKLESALIHERD